MLHHQRCLTQALTLLPLPVPLKRHLGLVACELHQVVGKAINGQAVARLFDQERVQGVKEEEASVETLLVAALYSGGFWRALSKASDGRTEGLL